MHIIERLFHDIERKREELNNLFINHSPLEPMVLKKSQELDVLIVEYETILQEGDMAG